MGRDLGDALLAVVRELVHEEISRSKEDALS